MSNERDIFVIQVVLREYLKMLHFLMAEAHAEILSLSGECQDGLGAGDWSDGSGGCCCQTGGEDPAATDETAFQGILEKRCSPAKKVCMCRLTPATSSLPHKLSTTSTPTSLSPASTSTPYRLSTSSTPHLLSTPLPSLSLLPYQLSTKVPTFPFPFSIPHILSTTPAPTLLLSSPSTVTSEKIGLVPYKLAKRYPPSTSITPMKLERSSTPVGEVANY